MKNVAIALAIVCALAAVLYFVLPAGSLPSFVPGYEAGSSRIHVKHGLAAAVAAALLFALAWWASRERRPMT
jgi:hypothetical protein